MNREEKGSKASWDSCKDWSQKATEWSYSKYTVQISRSKWPRGQAGGGNKPGRGYAEYKKDGEGSGKLAGGLLLHEEHHRAFH